MPPKRGGLGGPGGPPGSSRSVKSIPTREKEKQSENSPAASSSTLTSKKAGKQPAKPDIYVTHPTDLDVTTSPVPSIALSTGSKKSPRKVARKPKPGQEGWRNPVDTDSPFQPQPRKFTKKAQEQGLVKKPNTRPVIPFSPFQSPWASSNVSLTSSVHTEPVRDRRLRPILHKREHYDISGFFDTHVEPPKPISRTVLMLITGQGGTFSYGPKFKNINSKGQLETVLHFDAEKKIGSTKVRHLRSYGPDVDWIGTKECVSCIGVYFEISCNRMFCAHVNAWMAETGTSRTLLTGDWEYLDLKNQFEKKMEDHAQEHGWNPRTDVKKDTIRLTSSHGDVLGYAIQDALWELLELADRPKTVEAHGFLIVPRQRHPKSNGMMGKFLKVKRILNEPEDEDEPARWDYEADDVPSNFTVVDYTEAGGQMVPDEWTLTAGLGWSVREADGRAGYFRYPEREDSD